ncbi:MAG: hypothetical protein ACFFB8_13845, partial [Promethearchaeota archaeon]
VVSSIHCDRSLSILQKVTILSISLNLEKEHSTITSQPPYIGVAYVIFQSSSGSVDFKLINLSTTFHSVPITFKRIKMYPR